MKKMDGMKTPTLDKMREVQPISQQIGHFLVWLNEQGIELAKTHEHSDGCEDDDGDRACGYRKYELEHYPYQIENILALYFEIDLKEADKEKERIYASL